MESFGTISSAPAGLTHLWAYAALILMVIVEGPISILVAAGLVTSGYLQPAPVFWTATLGNLIADLGWYSLGYYGLSERLALKVKFLKIDLQKIHRLTAIVQKHGVKLLLFAKLTNGLIVPVLVATGMARVSMKRWFPIIFTTNLLTSFFLVWIGYNMASSLTQVKQGISNLAIAASLLLFLVGIFVVRHVLSRRDLVSELENKPETDR